ncbi:hypothetical protein ALC53_12716, partial [Atta colombica]
PPNSPDLNPLDYTNRLSARARPRAAPVAAAVDAAIEGRKCRVREREKKKVGARKYMVSRNI